MATRLRDETVDATGRDDGLLDERRTGHAEAALPLVAHRINACPHAIVPAPRSRQWMDETNQRFAYRCLPLVIANQAGWWVLNPQRFRAAWDGGAGTDAVILDFFGEPPTHPATSHFGHGLLTFDVPFLFRTPPGWNLLARGPSNLPKAGIAPLDGLVETDWSIATFTMNWQFTAVDQWVTFEKDEPYCMIVPQARGILERFAPEIVPLAADRQLGEEFDGWRRSRGAFNMAIRFEEPEATRQGWQRHYVRG